jgi:hypothetical protein
VQNVEDPKLVVHVYEFRDPPELIPRYFTNEEGCNLPSLVTVNASQCRRLLIHANGTLSRETLRIFRSSELL